MTAPVVNIPMAHGRTPRGWQFRAWAAIGAMLRQHQSVISASATGTGKGDLAAALCVASVRKGNRVLVLAERTNLVHEIKDRVKKIPAAPSCGLVIGNRNEWLNPIVSASVQTLSSTTRLAALDRFKPRLVITDEAHHSVAPSYRAIYDYLNTASPNWKHIGLTATPFRTGPDGSTLGLGAVFEAVAFEYTIEEAIAAGDLVPIQAYQVDSTLSLDGVRTGENGDYDESDLAKAVDCDSRNDLVVDEYERLLNGQPAGVFCVNIAHAEHMAERFQARGINAVAVSGKTKGSARILHDFKTGKFPVICSCDLIREGWDAPNVVGILKARPTKSLLVFVQMLGRGTRTSPSTGKTCCIFVDFVDNGCTFTLETIANLSADENAAQSRPIMIGDDVQRRHYDAWGTGTVLDMREVGPVTEYKVGWPMTEENPTGRIAWHPRKELRKARHLEEAEDKPEPLQPKVISAHRYEIQLFGRIDKGAPPPIGWYEYDGALIAGGTLGDPIRTFENGRWHTSSIEYKLYLHAKPTGWEVWSLRRDPTKMDDGSILYTEKITNERRDLFDRGTAVLWAQEHLRALGVRIVDHTAQWRGENATDRQRSALRSWGIRRDTSTMSRGEASVLLDAVVARRKVSEAVGGGRRGKR